MSRKYENKERDISIYRLGLQLKRKLVRQKETHEKEFGKGFCIFHWKWICYRAGRLPQKVKTERSKRLEKNFNVVARMEPVSLTALF